VLGPVGFWGHILSAPKNQNQKIRLAAEWAGYAESTRRGRRSEGERMRPEWARAT